MRIIINYGCNGYPEENWYPWLKSELEVRGHTVVIPSLPSPEGHNLENYLSLFPYLAGDLDSSTVLVGHSLGCAFCLRLLERASAPIAGTFLTAGFLDKLGLEEFDPIISTFVSQPFDFDAICKNGGVIHAYHGDRDPYVPRAAGDKLASSLGVELKVVPSGGHLNESAGFKDFPLLLADLLALF